jgi:autotransporter-associated beta strand protein
MNSFLGCAHRTVRWPRALFGFLIGAGALASAQPTTLYDSAGFESPVFLLEQNLDGQDPAPPVGSGPWVQDDGTASAVVSAINAIDGSRSVVVTRPAAASGNTRWGVVKPAAPTLPENIVDVYFDMQVAQRTLEFGPLFGVEAYDGSGDAPKLIGSLFHDASTGELVCQQAGTGTMVGTGFYPDLRIHHHYRLSLDFAAGSYSIHVNGRLVHTEGFVNPAAVAFTDAPLATVAAGDPEETGKAYFDNYRIVRTTSRLDHLVWTGGLSNNTWDPGHTANWYDGIGPAVFTQGAAVVFDDSGAGDPIVRLEGNLEPSSVTVSATRDFEFGSTGSLVGAGSLVKEGSGTLALSGPHSYSGSTSIHSGVLLVANASGSATGTGSVAVAAAGTLSGGGQVGGDVVVSPGGRLAPGAGVGTLAVGGDLVLNGSVLKYELGSSSDLVTVAGDLVLNGALEVTAAAGFGPGTYRLISYGGQLTAQSFLIAGAPEGYDYTLRTSSPGAVELVVQLPPVAPAAPDSLAAAAADPSAIDLTWADRSDNEDGFVVERSLGDNAFGEVATVGRDETSFSDGGLSSGTTYFYRVRAINAGGASGYSNVAAARTPISPPVARYEFELNPLDSSGNNRHGAPVGTVLYDQGRVGEHAAVFNGSGFVSIARMVEESFTVSMWIKTTGNVGSGQWYNGMGLVDGEMVGGAADWGCSILNSKFAFGVGAPDTTIVSKRSVNDGLWHHLAATRDSSTGKVELYIDGALDTVAVAPTGARTAPVELRIGASRSPVPVFFVGGMDDLQFHAGVLNPAEVAELSSYPEPPPPPTGDIVKIHPLGDSITWGYTTASAADSPGGYREPLYRNLIVNGGPAVEFLGANTSNPGPLLTRDNQPRHDGYPQYTITEISNNLDANVPTGKPRGNNGGFWLTGGGVRPAIEPDIILLLAGTNDIEGGADAAMIESRMDAMVAKIFALRPAAKIFLASIPPYPADAAKTATAAGYNRLMVLRTVPKYLSRGFDIRFVDQYRNFIAGAGPEGDVVIAALYGDTIHPNEAGYQLMGDTWAAAILADPQPLPGDPSNLFVAEVGGDGVMLEWTDDSSNEGAFLIRRSLDGVHFETIGYVGANVTRFTDSTALPGTTYYYQVIARNSSGDSGSSNHVSTLTPPRADYSGRAVVAALGLPGSGFAWGDTGELPREGGTREASILTLNPINAVSGEVGHAFTIGQGDRTRSEASLSDVVIDASGVSVKAGFAMARALAIGQSGGSTAVAGASEIGGLVVAGFPVAVSGQVNQTVSLPVGKLVINEQITTDVGITVNALHLTLLDGTHAVIASAHAGYESTVPAPPLGEDQLSGGGWISVGSGGKGNFGVGGGYEDGVLFGHLTYRDQKSGMRVRGSTVTAYRMGPTPNSRRIEGTAEIDGVGGFTFAVVAEDNGEPGDADTFSLDLSNGYHASGVLGGGNIQLHVPGQ